METFIQMQNRLRSDLMAASTSTFYSTARIKELIQDAYLWACGLYEWPMLEKAYYTTSTGTEYYDYPQRFKTDTLKEYILVNGKPHKKKLWDDYLEYKRLNPTSTDMIFAEFARQYFIFPTPDADLEICIWGIEQPTQISADGDMTIFSNHDVSGNEAIKRKAFADAIRKINPVLARDEEKGAIGLLTVIMDKIKNRAQYAQPIAKPMFNVPQLF